MPYVMSWLNQQLLPRPCLARATPILSDWWRRLAVQEWDRIHPQQKHVIPKCTPTTATTLHRGCRGCAVGRATTWDHEVAVESEPQSERLQRERLRQGE